MEELKKLIYNAIIEEWPDLKRLPDRFFNRPDGEGIEEILGCNARWSVSLVIQDSDRVMVSLYLTEPENQQSDSPSPENSLQRAPFQKFWVKNIVNPHGKYLVEHQGSGGEGITSYWSLSELTDRIEAFFNQHEKGI